jgi:small-conductance mechanosensitive channel
LDKILDLLYDSTFGAIFEIDPGIQPYFKTVIFVLLAMMIGIVIRQVVIARIGVFTTRTVNIADDVFLEILRKKTVLWVVLLAGIFAIPTLPWESRFREIGVQVLMGLFVLSFTLSLVRGFGSYLARYGERSGTGSSGTTLIRYVISFIVWSIGIAIILSLFDVSLLPALTALGVGGLAVALAFQDTLANLFAGIHITLSGQMRIGDYVEISGDPTDRGFIGDIGWRTTTLRTLANNMVIIPNKKLAESTVINYSLPESVMAFEVVLSVAYDTDPDFLETIIIDEVLQAAGEINGLVEEAPAVRFTDFAESALTVKVYTKVERLEQSFEARHRMMKRLNARLRREGIEFPFPIRTLRFESSDRLPFVPAPTGNPNASTLAEQQDTESGRSMQGNPEDLQRTRKGKKGKGK